jgi:hypothetical protein
MSNQLVELSKRISQPKKFGWDEAVSVGQELRRLKELSQWAIGDLANRVAEEYGSDSIGKYAYAIGLEKKTVWEYMRVARKYKESMRIDFLSFRHHQVALRTDEPDKWLERANDKNWSSNQLYKAIKEQVTELPQTRPHDHRWEYYRKCLVCGTVELVEQENGLGSTSPANHAHRHQYVSLPTGHVSPATRIPS